MQIIDLKHVNRKFNPKNIQTSIKVNIRIRISTSL